MTDFQNFRLIARDLDPRAALHELEQRPELWSLIKLRQQYAGTAHRDTQTIVLRGPTTTDGLFDNLDAVDYPYFHELTATKRLLNLALEPLRWQQLGRIMIVRLAADGEIAPHVDEGMYARYFARFHLALETTP